ncbi:MAG: cytochrome c [Pirellulales bacterium]
MKRLFSTPVRVPSGALLIAVCLLAGCDSASAPRFSLNMMEMEKNEIAVDQQQQIATALEAMFGTPDEPFVVEETGLDLRKLQAAAGSAWSDESGQEYGLYRQHCAHCHGISGDGYGPTAAFLNPYPRDYTLGKFKFKSTERTRQPTHDDLVRVLDNGIPGTSMPSFRLLSSEEKDALVEYVKYLAMRGQMETALVAYCADELDEGDALEMRRELLIDELLADIAEGWKSAGQYVIHPDQNGAPVPDRSPDTLAASASKGRELFYGKHANCFSCHGETAIGDGQTTEFDDWSKLVKEYEDRHPDADLATLGSLPPRPIRPRNLRDGIYRGGRRPLDLYWRIYTGINGTPMPAIGPATPGGKGVLTSQDIWHLVDYLLELPFEPASMPPRLTPAVMRERP